MTTTTIRLLHVEDDMVQQRLVAFDLGKVSEYRFDITCAKSEDEAVAAFERDGADLVLLDYHLTQGNGLSVLEHIRRLDPLVPVIALSGAASPRIAAELVRAGADDFIAKGDLATQRLTASVRMALVRSQQVRARLTTPTPDRSRRQHEQFGHLCAALVDGPCPDLLRRLDELEEWAQQAKVSATELERLFQTACDAHDVARGGAGESGWRLLRPVWLELRERLFGPKRGRSGFLLTPATNGN
jgi:CheY-like chemotaxis protein